VSCFNGDNTVLNCPTRMNATRCLGMAVAKWRGRSADVSCLRLKFRLTNPTGEARGQNAR
jgi:hypothetical protein